MFPRYARCVLSRLRCNGHNFLLSFYLSKIGIIENPSCSACGLGWPKILKKIFFSLIVLSVDNIVPFGKCISDTKFYKKSFTFDPGSYSLKV